MIGSAAPKTQALSEPRQDARRKGNLATRKIWLPKLLYNALPCFYLLSGIAALLATLYISEWFWVLPHYLLFSAACLHLSISIYRRRIRRPADDEHNDES